MPLIATQVTQRQTEVVIRFTVIGIGIPAGKPAGWRCGNTLPPPETHPDAGARAPLALLQRLSPGSRRRASRQYASGTAWWRICSRWSPVTV